jgi:hypothetical protein
MNSNDKRTLINCFTFVIPVPRPFIKPQAGQQDDAQPQLERPNATNDEKSTTSANIAEQPKYLLLRSAT